MSNSRETVQDLLIEKSREKTYFEVPFTVPENVARIEIRYQYVRRERVDLGRGDVTDSEINIIDLGLRDERGQFRGASGSERLAVYLTENEATPGYIRGPIRPGSWAVVFGAYKIQPGGCRVRLSVTCTPKEPVWLKGDLHMHTVNSDGRYTVPELTRSARLHGLDFIFVTDHNTYAQNDQLPSSDELVVLPGMEWTHYKGHANFLGCRRPISHFVANDKETTVRIMREARENGAMVVLNHPFCRFCPWLWGFDVPFDGLEIWNGPMKDSETDAVAWWNERLKEGRRIPAVGGSDSHRSEFLRMIGTPCTFVRSDSRGASDILRAIRGGHAFVTFSPDGPTMELTAGDAVMGDTVPASVGEGRLTARRLLPGDRIRLISENGTEREETVGAQSEKTLSFPLEGRIFIRAEIWREIVPHLPMLAAVSNPLYCRG